MITDDRLDKKLAELESIAELLINMAMALKREVQEARTKLDAPNKKLVSKKDSRLAVTIAKRNAKIFRK